MRESVLGRGVAALVALTAVPAAVLAVPNVITFVAVPAQLALGGGPVGLVQAAGAALPALVLALPPAAVAARRLPPPLVLLAGIFVVLAGQVLALRAGSLTVLGTARALQGAGAGAILPAALTLAWRCRARLPLALFSGAFCGGLVLAMPLALTAVPRVPGRWREALTPCPWLLGLGLMLALIALLLRDAGRPTPPLRTAERTRLLLPLVPTTAFAFLAMTAVGSAWEPGVNLIVAGLGILAFSALALTPGETDGPGPGPRGRPGSRPGDGPGSRRGDGPGGRPEVGPGGRPRSGPGPGLRGRASGGQLVPALVMVLVGVLVLPVAAPLTGLAVLAGGGTRHASWPFAVGAVTALAGALCTVGLPARAVRTAVVSGTALLVLAILLLLGADPTAGGPALALPLAALGGGAGLALAASLRDARLGAAQFALALCFPALLCGNLIAGSLQVDQVQGIGDAAERLQALTSAFRAWLVVAGLLGTALVALFLAVPTRTRHRDVIGEDRLSRAFN